MQSITAVDILAGLKAAEAGQRAQKSVLGNRNPVCVAAAEAGPPLTPLSQIHQQQTLVEPSPLLKHNRTSQLLVGLAQNGETNATALEAADAAAAQSPARVAPPRSAAPPAAAQPPAPRQNPIITNAMSAVEEHGPWLREIPSVPVYTPSAEEWQDPLMYIRSIQPEAGKFGACVVKSPITPAVPAALLLKDLKFTTRLQKVKDDPWGKTWANGIKFWDSGRKCTVLEYAKFADDFARRKLGLAAELPTATVESMYWREKDLKVTRSGKECTVEYGNDIEGSAFHPKDPLGQSNWNLNVRFLYYYSIVDYYWRFQNIFYFLKKIRRLNLTFLPFLLTFAVVFGFTWKCTSVLHFSCSWRHHPYALHRYALCRFCLAR